MNVTHCNSVYSTVGNQESEGEPELKGTHCLREMVQIGAAATAAQQQTDAALFPPILISCSCTPTYSALRKYSAPLNFATFCHISGFKHKDIKLYFFCEESTTSGTQS